jgi:hypothetical protein
VRGWAVGAGWPDLLKPGPVCALDRGPHRAITNILMAALDRITTSGLCRSPQWHNPKETAPAHPAPLAGAVAFDGTVSR